MTVAELIAKLRTMPDDLPIVVPGYEWGYGRIEDDAVRTIELVRDEHARREFPGAPASMSAVVIGSNKSGDVFIPADRDSCGAAYEEA